MSVKKLNMAIAIIGLAAGFLCGHKVGKWSADKWWKEKWNEVESSAVFPGMKLLILNKGSFLYPARVQPLPRVISCIDDPQRAGITIQTEQP